MKKTLFVLFVVLMTGLPGSLCFAGGKSQGTSQGTSGGGQAGSTAPITFSIWVDHPWFWFDQYGKEDVSKKMTEITGVTLNMTRATDATQLPIMIASGDLPDLVYTDNGNALLALSDPNISWPMNQLVQQYGVDLHITDVDITHNTAADGNYYTIKNIFIPQARYDRGEVIGGPGTSSIAYRTDIYAAIGSPPLNNMDDLENALTLAKARYPNIVPLLNDGGINGYFKGYFMRQLGIVSTNVQFDARGKVIHIISNPDLIKFFELANRYYRKGLISAEAQTYNFEKFSDTRNSGNSFMQNRSSAEAMEANAAQRDAGGSYQWKLITKNLGGSNMIAVDSGIGWSGLVITKKVKDPRRAIEYFGWHRQDESRKLTAWGIQGQHWDYNAQGQTIYLKEVKDYIATGGGGGDLGIGVWIFGDQGDENAFRDYSTTDPNMLDNYAFRLDTAKYIKMQPELYFAEPKEGDMRNTYTRINDMFTTASNEIVFAETEAAMRAAYERMKAQAASLGLANLEKWMNDTHRARSAAK
jgi:putative aldouronate transport system substrate-binding protein